MLEFFQAKQDGLLSLKFTNIGSTVKISKFHEIGTNLGHLQCAKVQGLRRKKISHD